MSLKFLLTKSWHVMTKSNQRKKWIAEEKDKETTRKEVQRAQELKKEQELRETNSLFRRGGKTGIGRSVSFMYEPPPGYKVEAANPNQPNDNGGEVDTETTDVQQSDEKKGERKKLSVEEKFPILKNAPTQGDYTKNVAVRHKPLGVLIRDVQCARCGDFGHRSGEVECPLRNVKLEKDEERQMKEDPLLAIQLLQKKQKFALKYKQGNTSPIHGGFSADHPNQQIIPDDEEDKKGEEGDEDEEVTQDEQDFINSLTPEEMKLLLKRYKKETKQVKKELKRQKKEKKGKKKKKKEKGKGKEKEEKEKEKDSGKDKRKRDKRKRSRSPSLSPLRPHRSYSRSPPRPSMFSASSSSSSSSEIHSLSPVTPLSPSCQPCSYSRSPLRTELNASSLSSTSSLSSSSTSIVESSSKRRASRSPKRVRVQSLEKTKNKNGKTE